MAYDEGLAERVRSALLEVDGIVEKKMFGGLAMMLHGNRCCGVLDDDLLVRLGRDGAGQALTEPHVREMDFTGKPMRTMVYVAPDGVASDEDLAAWVHRGVRFASALPRK